MSSGVYINGPLNIITVSNGQKKMSIIADFHEDVDKETKCNIDGSIQLETFIGSKLNQSMMQGIDVHIFIETIPMNHTKDMNNLNEAKELRYADRVIRMLMNLFDKEDSLIEITMRSDRFPNAILHFVDIRNLIFPSMDKHFADITMLITKISITSDLSVNVINDVKSKIATVNELMTFTYNSLFGIHSPDELMSSLDDDSKKVISFMVNKISTSYKDEHIKEIMQLYIKNEFKFNFDKFFKLYTDINRFLDLAIADQTDGTQRVDDDGGITYSKSYLTVKDELHKLDVLLYSFNATWFVDITSKVMDLYLIRKFLDTDIQLCISYTGIEHSMFIIYLLIKYFDYSIDSVSLINDVSKEQLINEIKNSTSKNFHKYLYPKKLIQCSSDTGFTIL